VGPSTGDFERWLKGALEVGHFYGSSVKGTWRQGSLAGDPGRGSSTRDFERWMKEALGLDCFSLKRLSAGGL
jgi:hypothetical protein